MPESIQRFELSQWRGLNTLPSLTDKDPHYIEDCQNVDFDDDGVIAKRRGCTRVNVTLSGRINFIADFQSQQGFTTATDRQKVLVVAGVTLSVLSGLTGTPTVSATFTATNAIHYGATSNNGACYISNENGGAAPKVLCYTGGAWVYSSAELAAPTAAPNLAASASTASTLTGVGWKARTSYNDIFGNESNLSPAPTTGVTLSSSAFNVGIVGSADATVNSVNVYVLSPSSSAYRFVGTTSNANSTYSVTQAINVIDGGAEAEYDHFTCPFGKYVAIYNDMLIVAGDPTIPDLVYCSNFQFHRQFSTGTDFARATSGDGQPVKGFGKSYDDLVIAKADSIYYATGTDNTTFNAKIHNQEYGVLGQPSMEYYWRRFVFFSDDGIYVDNQMAPDEISRRIRTTLRQLNPGNLNCIPPKQFVANYKYYKKLLFSVREATGVGENDAILVYNYELDTWTKYKGIEAVYLSTVQMQDDYEYLYGGNAAGNIYLFNPPNGGSPNSDNFTGSKVAISAYAETPWIHLSKALGANDWEFTRHEAAWMRIYAGGEPASGNSTISIQTTYYTDFSSTVRGTFSTTHNAAAWPAFTVQPKLRKFGAKLGHFEWVKFRFTNNTTDEHFKIHKIVVGFRRRPALEEPKED